MCLRGQSSGTLYWIRHSGHSIKGELGVLDANLEVRTECESELISLKRRVIHTVAIMAKKTLIGGYCNRVVFPFWLWL